MKTIETDVVILGAGTAGLNARRAVVDAGRRWVMVEGLVYGTMCARVGCMPSKLLIAAAERAHDVHGAELFGLRLPPDALRVDGRAVLERVRRERDRFVGFVLEANERLPKEQNLFGRARFSGPTTVIVGEHTRVEARAVVLATGSTPYLPPAFASLPPEVLDTNDTIFERPDLPRSLAVIGTGVIGLELGQAMHRLGVKTTLFSRRGHFAGLSDPDVNTVARAVFEAELDVREAEVETVERVDGGVHLGWHEGRHEHHAVFERVLVATGRRAFVEGLDLHMTGLALDDDGVPRFDPATLQCGALPIFLAGDITGQHPILHEAADDGRIAGKNAALFPEVSAAPRRVPLAITFCDPNVAVVGERYSPEHAVGAVDMSRQGRSRIMGKNAGVIHVYGRRADRRLVGAELCAPRGEHLAHLLAWAIGARLIVDEVLRLPFYHPVVEEGLRTALSQLQRALDAPAG